MEARRDHPIMSNSLEEPPFYASPSAWCQYLHRLQAYLPESQNCGSAVYTIAGLPIRFHYGNQRLRDGIAPAFRHLRTKTEVEPALTVFLNDISSAPLSAELLRNSVPGQSDNDVCLTNTFSQTLIFQRNGAVVSVIDWEHNLAYWFTRDAASIPYLEHSAPLKALLSHWFGAQGKYIVHSAAVGDENGGVLIIGRGGAGKSTTSIACMMGGLEFLADDHCLVTLDPSPTAYSIYATAKLAESDLHRFPALAPVAVLDHRPAGEKIVFMLDGHNGIDLGEGIPIRAILLADIVGRPETSVRRIKPSEAFKALAPSCALHFPAHRSPALQCFSSLIRYLPAFVLELGSDLRQIPDTIRRLLREPSTRGGMDLGER
jgi:hypothetical protein